MFAMHDMIIGVHRNPIIIIKPSIRIFLMFENESLLEEAINIDSDLGIKYSISVLLAFLHIKVWDLANFFLFEALLCAILFNSA